MKTRFIHGIALVAMPFVLSTTGHAVTLGDLQGFAVLGQPLDVSVSVQAGDGETISDGCLSAQLLFGDFPQPSPSLHLQSLTTTTAPLSLVRIRSSAVVNEPVVTVALRATCGTNFSRRYVLLSDFPATNLPTVNGSPATPSAGVTLPNQKASSTAVTDVPSVLTTPLPPAATTLVTPRLPVPKPAKVAMATAPKKKLSPALHLAPLAATGVESDSGHLVLKLDSEMVFLNPDELAALVARHLALPTLEPESEGLKQSAKMETLQNELKAAKDLSTTNQAALAGLEVKLHAAEAERVPTTWLYLLGGALAAALAALAWVLRRQQNAKQDWWHPADKTTTEMIAPVTSFEPSAPATMTDPWIAPVVPAEPKPTPPNMRDVSVVDLDFDLDHLDAAAAPDTMSLDATLPDLFGITCDLNSETITDIRQQAEFFVSLGQVPRAIDLLREQIQQSTEPNPMVYLDLLALYHSQGMKTEFRTLRSHFNRLFHGVAPDFPAFYQEGRSLLDYPEPLAELVHIWPSGAAAAFLDGCIFRNETSAQRVGFDLAAFRDLLLLRTLVDKTTTSLPSLPATPLKVQEHQIYPDDLSDPGMMTFTSSPEPDPSTGPDAMLLAPSGWFTPPAVPTTEELDMEFPIDMRNIGKPPENH